MTTVQTADPAREVLNQAPPLQPINLYETDSALQEALVREGGGWGVERAREAGGVAGSPEAVEHGRRAERNEPILHTHDRYGNRIDEVELDPSWHWLLGGAIERGLAGLPWREGGAGAHVVRAALFLLWGQINDGVMCPVSMTYAAVPALRDGAPALAAAWEPRLTERDYASGALAGMAMTERQGGSDVRANITRADELADGLYELHGHKWFCSYPACDVFLVLAQAPGGLSCFLVERGTGMEFQRLKDKLGTRSLPSSEVEFRGARGQLVGEEGRGVAAIIRMVNHTRLDCMLGAAAGYRRGTVEAIHHARHRLAFGTLLAEQPAMRNVLADLALESEAATVAALRVARAYDDGDEAREFRRFATAVMKYWLCKRAPAHAAEALECLGGNGYVEDSGMPLLYRGAPLGSIWEGSGNVAALDVVRAMAREPGALPAFLAECELGRGGDRRLDVHLDALAARIRTAAATAAAAGGGGGDALEFGARRLVEELALALQGSLLVRHAPAAVADAFCASRLAGEAGRVYGTLPVGVDAGAVIDRAYLSEAGTPTRARLLEAARELVEERGYAGASVAAVADRAGVAAGTLYRHFASKDELFVELFRTVCDRELEAMRAGAATGGRGHAERIARILTTFAERALRRPRLAWALLAEPVAPPVDGERLAYRARYRALLATVVRDGIEAGELPEQDAELTAAALVGGCGEALVGPLAAAAPAALGGEQATIAALRDLILRAIGGAFVSVPAVRVERDGPVWTVLLSRPQRRNAVDGPTAAALADAFRAFDADPDAAVAVLHGEGGVFCSGADLHAAGRPEGNAIVPPGDGDGPMGPTRLALGKPVIAAIAGHAVAGGLELACWCDLRVAEPDAVLGVFCRRWGVPLIDGGTVRLPRLIGASRAMDLILTGRPVGAAEALEIGLINRLVGPGESRVAAEALARELIALPQLCLREDRLSLLECGGLSDEAGLAVEFAHGLRSLADVQDALERFRGGAGRHGVSA